MDKLTSFYHENGNNSDLTYKYLVDFLRENKNNPEILEKTVSSMLFDEEDMYDNKISYKPIAESQADVLEKFIISNENGTDVDGAICTTIHGFMRDALEKADIPAGIMHGAHGEAHAILVYKPSKGNYVFNNYGHSATIEANNIKDAMKSYYKNDIAMKPAGFFQLADGKKYYSEYFFEEESAFGEDIDKKILTQKSLFGNTIDDHNSLNVDLDCSAQGNTSQRVELNFANGYTQNTFSLEHKRTECSETFDASKSVGIKFAHTNIKNKNNNLNVEHGITGILSYLGGDTGYNKISVATLGLQGHKTLSNNIYNNGKTSIKLAGGISGVGTLTFTSADNIKYKPGDTISIIYEQLNDNGKPIIGNVQVDLLGNGSPACNSLNGDVRIGFDTGAEVVQNINDNFNMRADITTGITSDLSRHNYNKAYPELAFGTKLNTNLGLEYSNNQLELDSSLSFSSGKTSGFDEKNMRLALNGLYKANQNVTFGANINTAYQRGDIHVGSFNETIDKNINLNANIYAQFNNKLKINAGYELNKSLINTRKDYHFNIGLGYTL